MNSLDSSPVADVLSRLHRQAEAADGPMVQTYVAKGLTHEQLIAQFMRAEADDMRGLYRGLAGNFLCVSSEFGRFLYMCARACNARLIVEFGSSMGVSAIYMAAALRDNGGGRLIGSEFEPGKAERAKANLAAAALSDLVEIRVGDARETLATGVGDDIDMVMLDGAFTLYLPILKLLEPRLRPGAIVIGENAFAQAEGYIDYVRDPQNGYVSLPLPFDTWRGNELTVKTK